MEKGEIENLVCRALEDRVIVKVNLKSGRVLTGWVQHFEPTNLQGVFRMMVDRRYQQDVDLSNVSSVVLTDTPA